ncbi:hypothetical protein GCM10009559_37210 [Pseudonocardia zijingensis]|uniref:Uncharacterized protein n=1 Tax=Pseudonocardia zijingensis TaxID=153376 RepID=A0ABP4AV22_9PSEU
MNSTSSPSRSTQTKDCCGVRLKTHIGRLLIKLEARDRAQLVIAGYEAALANER